MEWSTRVVPSAAAPHLFGTAQNEPAATPLAKVLELVRNCGGERHAILFCKAVWHRNGSWLKIDMFVDLWQNRQALAICGQQNIAGMRRRVAR
jgi:hypothetical protein